MRKPREQIEVGRKQTGGVRNPIGDRDDEVAKGLTGRLADQSRAQEMFVARAALDEPTLVGSKRAREEAGLGQQPLDAAVTPTCASKRVHDELFKSIHSLRLPSQLVVEAHHLDDETWSYLERQRRKAVTSRDRRGLCNRLALDGRQPDRRSFEACVQLVVQLVARENQGGLRQGPVQLHKCARELDRGGAGWDQNSAPGRAAAQD